MVAANFCVFASECTIPPHFSLHLRAIETNPEDNGALPGFHMLRLPQSYQVPSTGELFFGIVSNEPGYQPESERPGLVTRRRHGHEKCPEDLPCGEEWLRSRGLLGLPLCPCDLEIDLCPPIHVLKAMGYAHLIYGLKQEWIIKGKTSQPIMMQCEDFESSGNDATGE